MSYIIVGLGNPGEEYKNTRHNTGRAVLEYFCKSRKFSDWEYDKKLDAQTSVGNIKKESTSLLLPDTFMNKSGMSARSLVKSAKAARSLIVVHDEIDLPIGTFKIVFNRGSGGHKGVESITRTIKTKAFTRVRVGITPATPSGKIRKPQGEKKVHDFILGTFKPAELQKLKRILPQVAGAIEMIIVEGKEKAMNTYN